MQYGDLQYGIPEDKILQLSLSSGRVSGSCSNINSNGTSVPLFAFHFEDLSGHGGVSYNDDLGAVALKIDDWELNATTITLEYPTVFLPEVFIEDMMKSAINASTIGANIFLYSHPYMLPDGFKAKVPNPSIQVYNQPGWYFYL